MKSRKPLFIAFMLFLFFASICSIGSVAFIVMNDILDFYKGGSSSEQPNESSSLPPHTLNDVDIQINTTGISGDMVWLFIVVNKDISEEAARTLIEHYRKEYQNAGTLIIDIFCDDRYAHSSYIEDHSVSDETYYSHVLYFLFERRRLSPITKLYTPTNPFESGQGSACNEQTNDSKLPSHILSDIHTIPLDPGDMVWLFIIVSKDLPEEDARTLIEHYREKYQNTQVLTIDLFCDHRYAKSSYIEASMLDKTYYSHVLYSFVERHFYSPGMNLYTPTNPFESGQGSACR